MAGRQGEPQGWKLLLVPVFPLFFCGILYSCSVPPRQGAEAFFEELRKNQRPPYELDSTNPADAAAALESMKQSTGFWTANFHTVSGSKYTRACLFIRVSLPGGSRWADVALEELGGAWKVRDLSFVRDCASGKRGDMRLH